VKLNGTSRPLRGTGMKEGERLFGWVGGLVYHKFSRTNCGRKKTLRYRNAEKSRCWEGGIGGCGVNAKVRQSRR